MIMFLFLLAIPICIADLSTFKIPNIYNILIFYSAIVHTLIFGLPDMATLATSLLIVTGLFLMGIGMGDLKLLVLILLTGVGLPIEMITFVFITAMVHIVISTVVRRTIPSTIAMAPSIFLGLATYLATG